MKVNFHSLRKAVLFSILAVTGNTVSAGVNYLKINLADGTNASFALADDPKVSIAHNELTVETAEQTITVPFDNLVNYTFYDSLTSGMHNAEYKNVPQWDNGKISFDGLGAGEKVTVYDTAGNIVHRISASDDGNATVDTSTWRVGVYIVRTSQTTIKFLKK